MRSLRPTLLSNAGVARFLFRACNLILACGLSLLTACSNMELQRIQNLPASAAGTPSVSPPLDDPAVSAANTANGGPQERQPEPEAQAPVLQAPGPQTPGPMAADKDADLLAVFAPPKPTPRTVVEKAPQTQAAPAREATAKPSVVAKAAPPARQPVTDTVILEPATPPSATTATPANTPAPAKTAAAKTVEPAADYPIKQAGNRNAASATWVEQVGPWHVMQTAPGACSLESGTIQVAADGYANQIWLTLDDQRMAIKGFVNIVAKGTKVAIDGSNRLSFSGLGDDQQVVLNKNLMRQLKDAKTLSLYVASPSLTGTTLYQEVSLEGLADAMAALNRCADTRQLAAHQ